MASCPQPLRVARTPRCGFTLVELLAVLVLLGLMAAAVWFAARQQMLARHCADNLRQVYSALELYEIDRGTLPRLAFFPDDPKQDTDSLVVALQSYGTGGDIFLCPTAPASLRSLGLTYVWNVQLNGKKLRGSEPPAWMLVDINAMSEGVPASHLGRYNILYTDGRVERSKVPPPGLRER